MGIDDDVSETETALLDDVVRGSVDFKGFPARRSKSGSWKSASFIIGTPLINIIMHVLTRIIIWI